MTAALGESNWQDKLDLVGDRWSRYRVAFVVAVRRCGKFAKA